MDEDHHFIIEEIMEEQKVQSGKKVAFGVFGFILGFIVLLIILKLVLGF
jgi:hypothetical protein